MNYDIKKIQDLWLKHIEVQERVLQQNSSPVDIEPGSESISGHILRLTASQNNIVNEILNRISHFFNANNSDIDYRNGVLTCDAYIDIDNSALKKLQEECAKHFIYLSSNPVIDGIIRSKKSSFLLCTKVLRELDEQYTIDSNRRLQLTVDAIRKLSDNAAIPVGVLPDNATAIVHIKPTPAYFLRKWLSLNCNHVIKFESIRHNGIKTKRLVRNVELHDCYFSQDSLKRLNELWGIRMISYSIIFTVNQEIVNNFDFKNSIYEFPHDVNGVFVHKFNINLETDSSDSNWIMLSKKWQTNLLTYIYNSVFGEENVTVGYKYTYMYDNHKYFNDFLTNLEYSEFFEEMRNKLDNKYYSISARNESLGIDFNWREKNVDDLRIETSNKYDDLEVSIFDDHRCNIDVSDKDADWSEIENFLKSNFATLKTFIDPVDGSLHFIQEYRAQEQASQFVFSLNSSSEDICKYGCEIEIHETSIGKQKYQCLVDKSKISENLESAVRSLRGAEFSINGRSIGKLIKVNFPELLFDISSSEISDISLIGNAKSIIPNLDGDLEKLSRLKHAFDNIISGRGVKNKRLKDFIFDASQAEPTTNISFYTNPSSDYYQDIKDHLLNKYINDSQLNAIIKCLKASDIALIQGPPGTGKSTAIAELIWQHVRQEPNSKILLTSETNLAVDNAIDRVVNDSNNIVKPIRFGSDDRLAVEGKQFSMAAMEQWVETGEYFADISDDGEEDLEVSQSLLKSNKLILINWLENIHRRTQTTGMEPHAAELWKNILVNPSKELRALIYDKYKKHCNVVGATCSSIGEKNLKNRPTKFFQNYCSVFGQVTTKTIYKRNVEDSIFDDEEVDSREIKLYECKDGISFTTVIQDESSKATPAELALPLIYGKKNIVIGDHRQLPPMLDREEFLNTLDFLIEKASNVTETTELRKLKSYVIKHFDEMEISHFQRLFENIDESLKGEFTLQYRMHPDINEVIEQFYLHDNGLKCGLITPFDLGVNDTNVKNPFSRYHGIHIENFIGTESLDPNNHVVWIDVNSPEMIEGTSRVNEGEVKIIAHILDKFSHSSSFKEYLNKWEKEEDKEIGIISFYSKQRKKIRNLSHEFDKLPMKIDVVDRFQGMERNIVIVSMVRSNVIAQDAQQIPDYEQYGDLGYPSQNELGFAQSPNRLNVALSRAKRLLIIIGNSELFRTKEIYDNVFQKIQSNPNGKIIKCNPYEEI